MVNPAVRYLPPSLYMVDFASRFGGKTGHGLQRDALLETLPLERGSLAAAFLTLVSRWGTNHWREILQTRQQAQTRCSPRRRSDARGLRGQVPLPVDRRPEAPGRRRRVVPRRRLSLRRHRDLRG